MSPIEIQAQATRIKTAKQIEEEEAMERWARQPVTVITNTSNHVVIWDINGTGTCSVRFVPGASVKATAMQMEAMNNPPPGIVVTRYNPDNPAHIRLKGIG